jgi:hypothetical protein
MSISTLYYKVLVNRDMMAKPERIEITREDFTRCFGVVPDPSVIGMFFCSPDGRSVIREFVFVGYSQDALNSLPAKEKQLTELERLFRL